jgi:hypothetical protein
MKLLGHFSMALLEFLDLSINRPLFYFASGWPLLRVELLLMSRSAHA